MSRFFALLVALLALPGTSRAQTAQAPTASSDAAVEAPPDTVGATPWGFVYAVRSLRTYPLVADENRIGRLPENPIALTSSRVSRRHGVIRRSDEGVEYVDIGSSNGSRVNGSETRGRVPVPLEPGDRIQVADELLLYHTSLDGLWNAELRMRLLSSMVHLNVNLPQDFSRKSLGQEMMVPVSTEALLSLDAGLAELKHSVALEPGTGFGKGTAAFVGNVILEDGVVELSLWALERSGSMTSRRASISRLKHTTLRVALTGEENSSPAGPWFPQQYLSGVFDVFPEARDVSLRFATSLAGQTQAVALRDASVVLAFRHALSGGSEWELLAQSAQAGGSFVEYAVRERRMSLTQIELDALAEALEASRRRLELARELGAAADAVADAESAIARGTSRLEALNAR